MSYTLPFKQGDSIVELGGGTHPLQGFNTFNVDIREAPGVDLVRDLEEDFSDIGNFDGLYARYIAEHISWRKIEQFFKCCYNLLNDGGAAVFIVPNTLEQFRKVVEEEVVGLSTSQFIFGDLDYSENSHKVVFSKPFITELLTNAGFNNIKIIDHPDPKARDMVVEAFKMREKTDVKYDRAYFEDPSDGYVGFWDFPLHHKLADEIASRNPESVLDVGGARGYIVKKLEARDIPATCLDMSEHCWHTRATDSFVLHDATEVPWPFEDNQFDLVTSFAFFEHIEEPHVEAIMREMARVGKRGLHNIAFERTPEDIDSTHVNFKSKETWEEQFKRVAPDHPVEVYGKDWFDNITQGEYSLPPDDGLMKINFGSFIGMFHYGWLNVDIQDLSQFANREGYKFVQHDVSLPVPVKDNVVDVIISHHLLEHLTRGAAEFFLKECLRVLQPEGVIRLSTPDVNKIIDVMRREGLKNVYSQVNVGVERARDESEAFFELLFQGHKTLFTAEDLCSLLEDLGFVKVEVAEFNKSRSELIQKQTVDSHPTLSVFIEAEKPIVEESMEIPARQIIQKYKEYLRT